MPDDIPEVLALPPVILKKPKYGSPCNGCGFCCHSEVCAIGKRMFPGAPAPCPGLLWEKDRYICDVIAAEQRLIKEDPTREPIIAQMLGAGEGCDSRVFVFENDELTEVI